MTGRRDRAGEAGFLLAEMLTTLTISAFVLAGLVGLGGLMLRTTDRSITGLGTTDNLGRTLFSLDRLLRGTSRARLDGTLAHLFLFNGDEHRLIFAHREQGNGGLPATRAITLRSEPDGSLTRSDAPLPQTLAAVADLRFGPARRIYAGGPRFRFAYLAPPPAGKAAGPATKVWHVGDKMPSAVTIEAVDPVSNQVIVALRSTIAADSDLGCLDATLCGRADLAGKSLPASLPMASSPVSPHANAAP